MQVELTSREWREENIDTLTEWHPEAVNFASDLDDLVNTFEAFMGRYVASLVANSDDNPADLKAHCTEELTIYLGNRFDTAIDNAWNSLNVNRS